MEAVLAVMALLLVLFLAAGAYAAVKAVGAAKRGVDRTLTQARRTVEDHALRAKSFAQPGPAGEVAQLRLSLRTSMRATQDALHAGVAEDESLRESLGLFERLSAHGRELDAELRRLESEPDRSTLTARLPALRERTERITGSADALRWAARDRARRFAEDDLDSLSTQIDLEAGALRHWATDESAAPQQASRPSPQRSPQQPPQQSAQQPAQQPAQQSPRHAWPTPEDAGAAAGQTWPGEPQARPTGEPDRPAITPPGRRPTYSWQKKPRPESTT